MANRLSLFITFALWIAFTQSAFAEKYALLMGGSGEELEKDNFFKKDFERMKASLENRGWNVMVLFDGKKGDIAEARSATNVNIDAALKKYLQIVKPGDQMMTIAHAHGGRPDSRNARGHPILTEDSVGYPTSKLQDFTNSISKKAKSALLDFSCFSGNTQRTTDLGDSGPPPSNYCIATGMTPTR